MPPLPGPHLHLKLSHSSITSLGSSPIVQIHPLTIALQSQKAPRFRPQFSSSSASTPPPKTSSIPTKQSQHVPLQEPLPIKPQPASFPITSSTVSIHPGIPSMQQPELRAFVADFLAKGYADVDVSFGDAGTMRVAYGPPLFVRVDSNPAESKLVDPEELIGKALEAARGAGMLEDGERWKVESDDRGGRG